MIDLKDAGYSVTVEPVRFKTEWNIEVGEDNNIEYTISDKAIKQNYRHFRIRKSKNKMQKAIAISKGRMQNRNKRKGRCLKQNYN